MYNPNYDEYMRSMLGYSSPEGYMQDSYYRMSPQDMCPYSDDMEHLYPEVYRVVYPMVCSACDRIQGPVTDEIVTRMTNDIYDRVEADGRIRIEVSVEVRDNNERQNSEETRQPRRPRNRFLRDLIRILLLRELFRRRPRFPNRPQFPMRPF